MALKNQQQAFCDLGDASFYTTDCKFNEKRIDTIHKYIPSSEVGEGIIHQFQPAEGLFIAVGNWTPFHEVERHYELDMKMIKVYFFESGCVTLIQNGKPSTQIREGVNLYLNRPSKGRVIYGAHIPIRYVSVLLLENYFSPFLEDRFTSEDFDYSELFSWREFDYNTPEIGAIFLQIKHKLLSGETSSLYYESKVGELLSVVAGNFHRQKEQIQQLYTALSVQEQKALERARLAIERNFLNPPSSEDLCKIATMGHTKFRQTFRLLYGVSPREYILNAKLQYAKVLLSKPTETIGSIAAHLGYASAGKFSIAFQKKYNCSPREYRTAVQNGTILSLI